MVNVKDVQLGTTTRKSFAKINEVMQMPNLIEVQKKSYQWFLDEGLEEDLRIEPPGAVLEIIEIEVKTAEHFLHRVRITII